MHEDWVLKVYLIEIYYQRSSLFGTLYTLLWYTYDSGGSRISRRGGGVDLVGGGVDSRGGYVSKILYVKTKELGPLWGGGGAPP